MDESSGPQNRRSRRSNVLLAATVETSRGKMPVRLRNLSSDGALIQADQLPGKGEDILFRRNDIAVPGRVAWVHDGHAGLSFDQQLDPEVVLRNVPASKPKVQLKFRRPGLTTTDLTAEEKLYIRRWL